MSAIQTVDSAFTGGTMELVPLSAGLPAYTEAAGPGQLPVPLPISIVIVVFTIICIANIRTFINMAPALSGCLFRWKENLHMENSLTLSTGRNRLFYILVIPFCLTVSGYVLYSPDIISPLPVTYRFLAVTGAVILYLLLRDILALVSRSGKINEKVYKAAVRTFRTFFIIITAAMLITAGAMEIFSADTGLTRQVLLYEAALLYFICMVREAQIFKNTRSVFSAILYLCALEILPTGILVATAIVL